MIDYIPFDTALRMLVNAYLGSTVLLIAASYIGLAAIEVMEKDDILPKPSRSSYCHHNRGKSRKLLSWR